MSQALKRYLSGLPQTKELGATELAAFKKAMADEVIPQNLREAADRKRTAQESRVRAVMAAVKRDRERKD
jgi:hypothetical protein